jgi:hypothetical protein
VWWSRSRAIEEGEGRKGIKERGHEAESSSGAVEVVQRVARSRASLSASSRVLVEGELLLPPSLISFSRFCSSTPSRRSVDCLQALSNSLYTSSAYAHLLRRRLHLSLRCPSRIDPILSRYQAVDGAGSDFSSTTEGTEDCSRGACRSCFPLLRLPLALIPSSSRPDATTFPPELVEKVLVLAIDEKGAIQKDVLNCCLADKRFLEITYSLLHVKRSVEYSLKGTKEEKQREQDGWDELGMPSVTPWVTSLPSLFFPTTCWQTSRTLD